MRSSILAIAAALLACGGPAGATIITFDTDPFQGSTALTTPGRQVVGNELFLSFNIGTDVFSFEPSVFGVSQLNFVNDEIANVPPGGVNLVVLRTFDNDADPGTPFGAGNAANLIADQITTPGPGFFVYFNSGLNLPRLVFSTDLSDNTADLKILARMTNLLGQQGQMASFTEANFQLVPEPSGFLLMTAAGVLLAGYRLRRRRNT